MAPVRRYLRITKYSVLECRIYLEDPSLARSWLLKPRDPVLPRVIEAIRPLVIPKLREEKERARKKSSKKGAVKDVIVGDGFEVSIFLTETSTRHSLLNKHLHFGQDAPAMMRSNSSKLVPEASANPVDVEAFDSVAPIRVEEDSDEDALRLSDIPAIGQAPQQSKRRRGNDDDGDDHAIDIDSDADERPPAKRQMFENLEGDDRDDKKKLNMAVSYEGFAIYGRVLCLVVKKRDAAKARQRTQGISNPREAEASGQASMENWITSTQIPAGEDIE